MNCRRIKFSVVALVLQVVFIALFGIFGEYGPTAQPINATMAEDVKTMYPYFQDVHVMIFIGFGFLMTFLKRYGLSAVSINLLLAAFVVQWAFIVRGVLHHVAQSHGKFPVHLGEMLSADFAAATVLISFGAVLGKTSPTQLLIMAMIEVVLSQVNEYIGLEKLGAMDVGESMYIHAFGAYFGLAVARVLNDGHYNEARSEGSVYHSDVFSMIGTVFLWIFWPSFNAGAAAFDEQHRAIVNTFLSLAACTVTTFALSQLVDKKGRFNMVHVQNATLAGGVALGTSANMPIGPWAAMLVGCIAATISVLGYEYLTPFLRDRWRIHDTCGVHNLHGMPGILAGIVGAIAAATASTDTWGRSLYEIFPAMIPSNMTSPEWQHAQAEYGVFFPGGGFSAMMQGGFQMLALVITLVVALVGGAITGLLIRLPCLDNVIGDRMYDDKQLFIVEDQGFPYNEEADETGADANGADAKTRMI